MSILLTTLLPALLPGIADGVKGIVRRISGGKMDPADPQSAKEKMELMDADTRKLEALTKLDSVYGSPSQWVVDLRGAFRYVLAAFVTVACFAVIVYLAASQAEARPLILASVFDLARSVFFFAFGDRVYRTLKGV